MKNNTLHPSGHLKSCTVVERIHQRVLVWATALTRLMLRVDATSVLYIAILYFVLTTSLRQLALFFDYTSPLGLRDLGIFQQPLHNFITSGALETSLGAPRNPQSIFGEHAYLFIIVLVPLYSIFKTPLLLMLSQPVAYLLMIYVSYRIIRDLYEQDLTTSRLVAVVLLLNPAFHATLQNFNIYGFHLDFYFPPLFLAAYYFYEQQKTTLFIILYLLSLSVIESYSVVWMAFSLYRILCTNTHRPLDFVVLAFSSLYAAFMFFVFVPYFRGTSLPWYGSALSVPTLNRSLDPLPKFSVNLATTLGIHLIFNYAAFLFLPLKNKQIIMILLPVYFGFILCYLNGYTLPLRAGSWHVNSVYPILILGFIKEVTRLSPRLQRSVLTGAVAGAILVTGGVHWARPAYNEGIYTLITNHRAIWRDYNNIQSIKKETRDEPILVSFQLGKYFADFKDVGLLDESIIKPNVQYILYYPGLVPLSAGKLMEIEEHFRVTKEYKDVRVFTRLAEDEGIGSARAGRNERSAGF